MRKIEFKSSVSGMTKIFVGDKELSTALDPKVLQAFRVTKSKLPPVTGQNILQTIAKKLANDHINLAKDETSFILNYVKEELGI